MCIFLCLSFNHWAANIAHIQFFFLKKALQFFCGSNLHIELITKTMRKKWTKNKKRRTPWIAAMRKRSTEKRQKSGQYRTEYQQISIKLSKSSIKCPYTYVLFWRLTLKYIYLSLNCETSKYSYDIVRFPWRLSVLLFSNNFHMSIQKLCKLQMNFIILVTHAQIHNTSEYGRNWIVIVTFAGYDERKLSSFEFIEMPCKFNALYLMLPPQETRASMTLFKL